MKVVVLDAATLPLPLRRPTWTADWIEYRAVSSDEIVDAIGDATIAITNKVPLRRADLIRTPQLQFICVAATGYDCVDVTACRDLGITVSNVPGYSTQSVSEWVIASIFALRRKLFEYGDLAWHHWAGSSSFCVHGSPMFDISGATLGIVGRGAIGQATARLAKAIGMQVLFAEHRGRAYTREDFYPFEEVLKHADVLTLHCPLEEATRDLIGERELALLKRDAMVINSGRGALVDIPKLLEALSAGQIGGAALDVLPSEPPELNDLILRCAHRNLILTPHISWAAPSGAQRLINDIEANLNAFRSSSPIHVVSGGQPG